MSYSFSKTIDLPFDKALAAVVEALKAEGFGVLTEIDVKATMKAKLGVDFRDYRILGACNPPLAYEALSAEEEIGLMLPCNVVVQDAGNGRSKVSAVDPAAAMSPVDNPALAGVAEKVRGKLQAVIARL